MIISRIFSAFFVSSAFLVLAVACGSSESVNPNGAANADGAAPSANDATANDGASSDAKSGNPTSEAGGPIAIDEGGTNVGEGGSVAPNSTRTVDSRPYGVVVPSSYSATTPTPILVLLHGYGETAAEIDLYFGTSVYAAKKGFLLVLPNGLKDALGYQYWNADDACCDLYKTAPDDSGYLHDIVVDMKSAYNVDPKRVYFAGHSNGGFMAHRMACDHADEIAAVASLAGAVWKDATKCTPSAPISVLEVHGDADEIILYNGGQNVDEAAYPGAVDTIATWATKNGCAATLTATGTTYDLEATIPGAETEVQNHSCTTGAAELWTIHGGQHIPTFQPIWAETMYGFLDAHPKP